MAFTGDAHHMTILVTLLIVVAVLAAISFYLVSRPKNMRVALSDERVDDSFKSAPPLTDFQRRRIEQRWHNRIMKARFGGRISFDALRVWGRSQMAKMNDRINELRSELAQLKTGQKKRKAGRHSLAYSEPMSDAQKRRAARLRLAAIRRSAEFIREMRESKGLVPVVLTARQQSAEQRKKYGMRDVVLWRDVKASA